MSDTPIYFRFYIDDYMRDCEELSLTRHGAYLKLMIWYYSRAKPIPASDLHRIYARVGALSHEEKAATEWVLTEFFVLDSKNGVWRHKRIDAEIARFDQRVAAARESGRASARARSELLKSKHELPKPMPLGGGGSDGFSNENNEGRSTDVQRTFNGRSTNHNHNQNHKGADGFLRVGSISNGLGVDRSPKTEKPFYKIPNSKIQLPANWHTSPAACEKIALDLKLEPRGNSETRDAFMNRVIDAVKELTT